MKLPRWYEGKLWSGMELGGWLRMLARNRFAVHPSRWTAAAGITLFAAANTLLGCVEALAYGRRLRRVTVPDDPIFIIGHWRTGTTMLHELLALDPRHRSPTTYECLSPNHFLVSENLVRRFLWFVLPRTRPMDNMRMSFDRPQEDEAALCNLGQPSPFLTVAFPNRPLQHPDYVDFERLSPRQLERWRQTHAAFLRKVLFKRSGRLILKSPQHMPRVQTLAALYPSARFVHIARNPYVVFSSTVHFWKTMYRAYGLQQPDFRGLEEFVLSTYDHFQTRLCEAREALPPERFCELRYEDLVEDPTAELRKLYACLELPDFASAEAEIARWAARSKRYQPNRYEQSAESRDEITRRWRPHIERQGYACE